MQIVEAHITTLESEDNAQLPGHLNAQLYKQADKKFGRELLATSAWTALASLLGTAALVGIHHRYRKQRQPNASLQDYATGIRAQLPLLVVAPKPQLKLMRFRHACQQATAAWQQAYGDFTDDAGEDSRTTELSAIHTTTMLVRPICWVSGVAAMAKDISPMTDDANHESGFGVVGIDADRQIVWQTTMPERVHDIVVQPVSNRPDAAQNNAINDKQNRDVVVMGRRPSEQFWVLNAATGQVKLAIKAATNRHFYGHACYSLDGQWLYVTENDTVSLDGKVGIYATADNYKKVAEFDSHGIGPHELIMHPDGKTLVIANGGIKTEQASREELNLDSMRPSLVYLNRYDGSLLEQVTPEHKQMSVRHLAMHHDGTVMIGIQFQGERHINVPLVLTHKRGDTEFTSLIMPNNQWQRFHQYIASVAVDSEHDLLCVTTPIGGCAAIYDLNTRELIDEVNLPDCAGAAVLPLRHDKQPGFIVSDGQGRLTTLKVMGDKQKKSVAKDSQSHKMSFDNHLQVLG